MRLAERPGLLREELGPEFDFVRALDHGSWPRQDLAASSPPRSRVCVDDHLEEEIAAEGLARNLAACSGFLNAAAWSDGEVVTRATEERDRGVSSLTVEENFQIQVQGCAGVTSPRARAGRTVASSSRRTSTSPASMS